MKTNNYITIISSRRASSVLALAFLALIVQQMVVTVSNSQPVGADESPESKEWNKNNRVAAAASEISRADATDVAWTSTRAAVAAGKTAIEKVSGNARGDIDCYWVGVAPFCDGQCPNNAETRLTDERGDGMTCWTGTKHYCCPI